MYRIAITASLSLALIGCATVVPTAAPEYNGYAETAQYEPLDRRGGNSIGVGSISATFTVPPIPADHSGGVLFWIGGAPNNAKPILQTVLQYDTAANGPGPAWVVASESCCTSDGLTKSASTPVSVKPGDVIAAAIACPCTISSSSCTCKFTTTVNGQSLPAFTATIGSAITVAYGGTLELKHFTACQQLPLNGLLPDTGMITFTDVALTDLNGKPLQPEWNLQAFHNAPACGFSPTGAANAVTLAWSTTPKK